MCIYIYIYIYCGRKKTNKIAPTIYTSLYSYVLSTVLRKSQYYTLYIYIFLYIYFLYIYL